MARRQLLTDEERQALFGIPADPDGLARCFTLSRADQDLVAARRGDADRLGYAAQLALLRHPGTTFANLEREPGPLVAWLAAQLEIPAAAFAEYARRPQTMTDHARRLAAALGLRPPAAADLPPMIEAAAEAAWGTDCGRPIAAAAVAVLRGAGVLLPAAGVVERAAIAGRARARKRAADALLQDLAAPRLARLDGLPVPDPLVGTTSFAWLKAMPVAPKPDHVGGLLERLRLVRGVGLPPELAGRVHEDRLRQLVREGHASDGHQLGRYAAHRRRAILAATVLDLEARLTDAVLDMADKLVGGLFAKARNATRRRYAATTSDVGRLIRLFHGTIDALAAAQAGDLDAFEALADSAGEDPLLRAGFPEAVLEGVVRLSRFDAGCPYLDHLRAVAASRDVSAMRAAMANLLHEEKFGAAPHGPRRRGLGSAAGGKAWRSWPAASVAERRHRCRSRRGSGHAMPAAGRCWPSRRSTGRRWPPWQPRPSAPAPPRGPARAAS